MNKPLIIVPLTSGNSKIINMRTTNLESFGTCPLKFKKSDVNRDAEYFEFGKIAHNAIQAYVFNPEIKGDILDFVCTFKPEYCDKIRSYLKLVDENILTHGYRAILNEINSTIEIHYGEYKILIEGTADLLFKRKGLDGYIVGDIKTSKGGWGEGVLEKKLQRYVYTYMLGQKVGFDKILGFEYMIFTKHVTPRYQCVGTYNLTKEEIETKIIGLITSYIYALEHDDRPAIKNNFCWGCPLKKNKQCPIYGGADFNL